MNTWMKTMTAMALVSSLLSAEVTLSEGSVIRLELADRLSSANARVGQPVELRAVEEVKDGETVVIARGARALGTVTEAEPKKRLGRGGKLDFSIDRVMATDGKWIPIRYTQEAKGNGKGVTVGVLTAATAIVFFPAAPFFLLMKGQDAKVERGTVFQVFTDRKHEIKLASKTKEANPEVPASLAENGGSFSKVVISANHALADVEVNGEFIGSAPATVSLKPGTHRIRVVSQTGTWERQLRVEAGAEVKVNAVLGAAETAPANLVRSSGSNR